RRDRTNRLLPTGFHQRIAGKEGCQVLGHTNGAHTWSTTAMRNTEGLVEIEVADIRANASGTGQPNLGIHIGAVHIDLTAVLMDDLADFPDSFLIDSMGRRIGDH